MNLDSYFDLYLTVVRHMPNLSPVIDLTQERRTVAPDWHYEILRFDPSLKIVHDIVTTLDPRKRYPIDVVTPYNVIFLRVPSGIITNSGIGSPTITLKQYSKKAERICEVRNRNEIRKLFKDNQLVMNELESIPNSSILIDKLRFIQNVLTRFRGWYKDHKLPLPSDAAFVEVPVKKKSAVSLFDAGKWCWHESQKPKNRSKVRRIEICKKYLETHEINGKTNYLPEQLNDYISKMKENKKF